MFGFAKKIGMTNIFFEDKNVPVTALEVVENFILEKKSPEKHGYSAIQIGAFRKKKNKGGKSSKAVRGHVKKYLNEDKSFLCIGEFRDVELPSEDKKSITIEDFAEKDTLKVTGHSIGKGFSGVVKRYDFGGQPATHGHEGVKARGSIGAQQPQRVIPGTKMAGQYGNSQVTFDGLKILAIDKEKNLLFVKGSVPGSNSNFIKIRKTA